MRCSAIGGIKLLRGSGDPTAALLKGGRAIGGAVVFLRGLKVD
jgi:hypothetical protein